MKHLRWLCMHALILILMAASNQYIYASELPLTHNEFIEFQKACPACVGIDVMVCGNNNIGTGNKFKKNNFFLGRPLRGYLISPAYLATDMRKLIRTEVNFSNLIDQISSRFAKLNLIVVSDSFKRVHLLSDPTVEVMIPEPLHRCLANPANKWGCGISKDKGRECCEKNLGSPVVKVKWIDKVSDEEIELLYIPTKGASKLIRYISKKTKVTYFCQTSESAKLPDKDLN